MLWVFGSINADLVFRLERLPQPGETVLCPSYDTLPGGKGANQAAAAAKAGAATRMVGCVGEDGHGVLMRATLEAAGVDTAMIRTGQKPTGIAMIGVDAAGENAIIVASGANLEADPGAVAEDAIAAGDIVLCQNELRPEATHAMIARARAAGARPVLNLAPAAELPARVLADLEILVVNEIELAAVSGRPDAPPAEQAGHLARSHDLACIVTLGAEGAIAMAPNEAWRIPALRITAVDTTGAGDAFSGVLAASLARGAGLAQALHRATLAASLTCEHLGAQTAQPTGAKLEARLGDLAPPEPLAERG